MESRLPKLASQFPSYRSKIESLKSKMESNNIETKKPVENIKSNATANTNHTNKLADENKAPIIPPKKSTVINARPTVLNKTAVKRPAAKTSVVIEPKRANLKTNMKATVRPVRPATSASILLNKKKTELKSSNNTNTAAVKSPKGPKPSKWDYKGRLEYTTNELTALKQKHREISAKYNGIQDEIKSLRDSENSCRSKTEDLQKTADILKEELDSIKIKNNELEKEKEKLFNELKDCMEEKEKIHASYKECKEECNVKATLLQDQHNEISTLKNEVTNSTDKIQQLETVNNDLLILVQDLDKERRYLHNALQEMKGNIRVFCRVRPKIAKEAAKNTCSINYIDECTIEIGKSDLQENKIKTRGSSGQEFTFDKVFPPHTSQADVFEELSMLVQQALEGYNVCVFAYGQTGSGKTHTMEGISGTEDEGMIPRTVKHIFKEMKQFELLGWEYKIEASFLEIYNEQIVDLLDSQKKSHEIRMADSKGNDLYVSNLHIEEINSPEELNQCLLIAQENRAVAATQSNERSSRSHSVARIKLIGTHAKRQEVSIGNLNLVDLAGSERLKNEEAARTTETKNINKSLANLGHVILALLQKQDHIPYRNSKLTHLLMPSLGGNSKTLMLLNISPLEESYNESLNSLRFGSNVNSCKTGTIKRVRTIL